MKSIANSWHMVRWPVLLLVPALLAWAVQVRPAAESGPSEGLTLFAPLQSMSSYLIDLQGQVVHQWNHQYAPGNAVYLLEDGRLLHTGSVGRSVNATFTAGGSGGQIQLLAWNSEVLWDFRYSSEHYLQHHDATFLPSGNVLLIAWERKTQEEAVAAGRKPSLLGQGQLWPDHLVEVRPLGLSTGQIVWEWHVWDHLVQDFDPARPNFGVVADHPERVDLNYVQRGAGTDWNHINSVAYDASLDQVILSVHNFNEIWVIDHGTTTEEAAGSSGGRRGRGGDLLYRWENPAAYGAGALTDQRLFGQHDAQWIATDLPGAGNILLFNNGLHRPQGAYSSVEEIVPPLGLEGRYARAQSAAYGPLDPLWTYAAEQPGDFYSRNISGVQRMPNGNTLICSGAQGWFFEVNLQGEIVWEYVNPFAGAASSGANSVFKARRYAPDYAGLKGHFKTD